VRALTDTNDLPGFASHDDRDTIEIIRDSGSADYDGGLFFSVISPGSMTIVLANFIRILWLYTYSNINHFLMIKLDTIFLNFFHIIYISQSSPVSWLPCLEQMVGSNIYFYKREY
jgi:hypothetical protein